MTAPPVTVDANANANANADAKANPNATADVSVTLEGVLERITYANPENAWSVVKLAVPGQAERVTAVGNLLAVQEGESLRLSGTFVVDKKYGRQLRVSSYQTITPATLVGIERYLASGVVKGLGEVMAKRIVERFGKETLHVIDSEPERLGEVQGIGRVRGERIAKAWGEQKHVREVMVFLQSHGVSGHLAVKVWKAYGENAIRVVRANPYRLALDIFGVGFLTADRIATSLGVDKASSTRAEAGALHVLGGFSDEGHVYCPEDRLVADASELLGIEPAGITTALDSLAASGRIVREPRAGGDAGGAVYAKAMHTAEVGVAELLLELLRAPATPMQAEVEGLVRRLEGQGGVVLAPEQREAVRQALDRKVLVVTGGPGTGKTTLVNTLIGVFAQHGQRVLLGAPTGRAAKRLFEATGHEAKTLHRLLEWSPKQNGFARTAERPLEADVVIIDEASMLDTTLAYALLLAVPSAARLVLVGDVDQLPSVGPGSVLKDLIASGVIAVARLRHIFRQARDSRIVMNAHRIHDGQLPELAARGEPSDFHVMQRETPEDVLDTVKKLLAQHIPERLHFDPIDDVQVLTPMHRGLLGAQSLNAELQALLNPSGKALVRGSRTLKVGDKVMQVRNNYDLDVFNGDLGRITSIDEVEQEVVVTYDGRAVPYEFADLDELALAYACSVHKAQGSEYPCVVLVLHTQHYMLLQRNLLYTAVTRGRREVIVVGNKRALVLAIKNASSGSRWTQLAQRLQSARA